MARAISVMYDLSGMRDSIDVPLFYPGLEKNLVDSLKITSGGKNQNVSLPQWQGPWFVLLGGVGFFNDGRKYTLRTRGKS